MTLKEAFELEKKANRALGKFKEELYERIGATDTLEGVQIPANAGTLRIAYVNLGTVLREKSLSPETYIPAAQADIVRKALASCSTITDLVFGIPHHPDGKRSDQQQRRQIYLPAERPHPGGAEKEHRKF